MRKTASGFTIIEILVVIAVIGILTTISVVSFGRYQSSSRDSQRASRATILVEALEKYYDKNGEYPNCNSIQASAATVTSTVLPGVESTVLVTPQETSDDNSIVCQDLTSVSSDPDIFAYVGDGSTACLTSGSCLQYTLKYKDEVTNSIKTVDSRRKTSVTTLSAITNLSATTQGFQQINLAWSAVANASSYKVEYSTSSTFVSTTPWPTNPTTNSVSVTGLTPGTLYYFRVASIASGVQSTTWSNTASATTSSLATPTCTATPNSISQITLTWNSIPLATSYRVEYADNAGFTSSTIVNGITSPQQYVLTGLSAGNTRYFRVYAIASGDISDQCPTVQATTTVPPLTCLNTSGVGTTSITATWAACPSAVADNYNVEYASNSGFTSSTIIPSVTGTSYAATGLTQGKTYWFRVFAKVGSVSATASPTASATTTINTPTGVGISTSVPGAIRPYAAGDWVAWIDSPASGNWYYAQGSASGSCPSGTSVEFQHGANYNSPSTFYGYTGWSGTSTKYMVAPYSGYAIRFHVNVRCVGSNATSGSVNSVSGYVYN